MEENRHGETGQIELIGDVEFINSSKGVVYHKRDVILNVSGPHPKKLHIKFWGPSVCRHIENYSVGDIVSVLFNIESKFVRGVWQTNLTGYHLKINE